MCSPPSVFSVYKNAACNTECVPADAVKMYNAGIAEVPCLMVAILSAAKPSKTDWACLTFEECMCTHQ